ncbi:beta-lactamase family protein [SAR92 clade bacterium H231]|nr:beta-lactamase family protein [SAR92 clade bacterium H231]
MDQFNYEDILKCAEGWVADSRVSAASIALWNDGQLTTGAFGSLNMNTGVEATSDSIFQIGSITKVMTTCLVMQLVDRGLIDLDRPVVDYLHDFQIADPEATRQITVRQLLNHTNGIAGDYFPDDRGHQGNLIARYVDRCSLLPLIHPVGEMYSYSNSAFAIAGRLVEVVSGMSWYRAMEEMIFKPLGMNHSIADPAEAIRFRAAMGHVYEGDKCRLADSTYLPLGLAPVGSTVTMSASDLITFARAHMDKGLSQSDERWLSEESIMAMQTPQIQLPAVSQLCEKSAGLGWGLATYSGGNIKTISHAGATCGSLAMLQILPEQNAAFAILMNGFKPAAMDAITADCLKVIAGLDSTEPEPPELSVATDNILPSHYVGCYESLDSLAEIKQRDDQLMAHVVYKIDPLPPMDLVLRPIDASIFATYLPDGTRGKNIALLEPNQAGQMAYLFFGGRLSQRL